jgi:hypothetical protein
VLLELVDDMIGDRVTLYGLQRRFLLLPRVLALRCLHPRRGPPHGGELRQAARVAAQAVGRSLSGRIYALGQ